MTSEEHPMGEASARAHEDVAARRRGILGGMRHSALVNPHSAHRNSPDPLNSNDAPDTRQPLFSNQACGVILAGGRSSRMGQDKAMLEIGGAPLLARIAGVLLQAAKKVVISSNRTEPYAFLGLPVITDVFPGQGPLSGIHAAMKHFSGSSLFVVACDMPFVKATLFESLLRFRPGYDAVVPVTSDRRLHPLCAWYGPSCLPVIERQLTRGANRVESFLQEPSIRVRILEPSEGDFLDSELYNINSRSDLEVATRMLKPGFGS